MKFLYKALDNGEYTNGQVEAATEREVAEYLRNNGLLPVAITAEQSLLKKFLPKALDRVSADEIITFTRQMALMLNAGLTITSSLDILVKQADRESVNDLYNEIIINIQAGDSFSKALSKQGKYFSRLYISLIKAGEASGKLSEIMLQMSEDLEKHRVYVSKVKGAMVYPLIILVGVFGVLVVLLTFVVPQLTGLYRDMGIDLPVQTRALIFMSDVLLKFWPLFVLLIVVCAFYVRRWLHKDSNVYLLHSLILKTPKFGEIFAVSALVSATRTFSLLLSSGVMVLETIQIVTGSTNNLVFQRALRNVYRSVQNGVTLSDAFGKENIFPPLLTQMVSVGERTGKIDVVMRKVSEFFELQSENTIKTLTTLIEPLILVLMGGVVFLVVMAVITPIYTLTTSIGQ